MSPTTADHVAADLGEAVDGIVDGGPCAVGIESTIVDLTGPQPVVLRLGAISPDQIGEVLGVPVGLRTSAEVTAEGERASAPGQLASHYAPRAKVLVVRRDEVAGFVGEGLGKVVVLGDAELGQSAEGWARNLYGAMRDADAAGPDVIVVPTPPSGAMAAAVADRLARAAAPRGGL